MPSHSILSALYQTQYIAQCTDYHIALLLLGLSEMVKTKLEMSSAGSWCAVTLVLLLPLPLDSSVKSNHISTLKLPAEIASRLHGSRSRAAYCPVLPPCRCVHSAGQGRPTVLRVTCSDSVEVSRRRVLRFSKTSSANPAVQHLSLAYAGLNALPAATFQHIKVCNLVYLLSNCH